MITVGTGPTVAHGIRHAIGTIRPDRIYYLVTEESERQTLPELRRRDEDSRLVSRAQEDTRTLPQEECVKIEGKDQLDQVFRQVYGLIQVIRSQDPSAEIYLDYTSRTKVMSAGAVLAACLGGVDKMTYVSGERERNGRAVSGTESVLEQPLVHFFFEDRKRFFFTLFDRYDFIGCYAVLQEISRRSPLQKLHDFVMFWEPIVQFYHQWDLFDHNRCEPKGMKGVPTRNKKFLGKLRSGRFPESDWCRLADLLNNAQRRSQEGRFDDATARLYRAMEFVAQLVLKGKGLDTSNVDLTKVPETLWEKYQSFRNDKGVV